MEIENPFLTVTEASGILRIHKVTLYRLCKEGKFPGVKIGGSWRIRRESLLKILITEK